ncbi:MAG: EAL domain-containing protein [Acholeplasmataceae bacterium]|jgi:EAL domain-containing protein (putative c-di-GMP-specific phosphodiesterase class I)
MNTLDVLSLPKNEQSLSIIKSFLQTQLTKTDYELVFLKMLEVELFLGLSKNVITEGEDFLTNFAEDDSKHYSKLLKYLFDAAFLEKDYDRLTYYLEERKKYGPILEDYLIILDEIELLKLLNKPYIDLMVKLVNSQAPNHAKIPIYEELLKYYIGNEKFDLARDLLKDMENVTNEKYYKEELDILYGLGKIDEVIELAESYKEIKEAMIPAVLMLLKVYFKIENYHQMTILDSNYERHFEEASVEERLEFYEMCTNLYKKLGIKQSEEYYLDNYKKLKKQETKTKKQEPTKEEVEPIKVDITEVVPRKKETPLTTLEEKRQISNFFDIFIFSENINEKLVLRDYLRTLFIFIDNYIKPSNYVIYLNDLRLFHYKKERLYEKRIIEEAINPTIIRNVVERGHEYFSNPLDFDKNIDIITQLPYSTEIKYIYAIPLENQGAFLVYFDEEINDPEIYYDFVKLLSALIFAKINREKKLKNFRKENFFLSNILKSGLAPLRIVTENKVKYNDLALKLFKEEENNYLDSFISKLKPEYIRQYREMMKKLLNAPNQEANLTYQFQNLHIKERLISMLDEDEIKVVSIFEDMTRTIIQIETSEQKAITDRETNLFNLSHLKSEMTNLTNQKTTFIAIELNLDNRHIYGPDDTSLYFKEFSKITDDFFVDGITYRIEFNELMVTLPYNDIRAVNNILKNYINYLEEYQVSSIPYEQFQVKMGVLRYPVVTTQTNIDMILKFVDIAKEKSKLRKDTIYHQFTYSDYEEEVFEQSILNYLNDSLEKKNLSLNFIQIIDINKNIVWQYESEINIPNMNIDNKYIITLAKKRNRINDLDRFHIIEVLNFLVKLSLETKVLIKITIPISEETFIDPTFNAFLIGAIKERKIPFSFIRLKIDLTNVKTHHYAHKIHELLNTGISLDTTALAMVLTYPFNALYIDFNDSDIKWQTYYSNLNKLLDQFHVAMVATNINSRDQIGSLKRLGIKLASGNLYPNIPSEKLFLQILEMKKNE